MYEIKDIFLTYFSLSRHSGSGDGTETKKNEVHCVMLIKTYPETDGATSLYFLPLPLLTFLNGFEWVYCCCVAER